MRQGSSLLGRIDLQFDACRDVSFLKRDRLQQTQNHCRTWLLGIPSIQQHLLGQRHEDPSQPSLPDDSVLVCCRLHVLTSADEQNLLSVVIT